MGRITLLVFLLLWQCLVFVEGQLTCAEGLDPGQTFKCFSKSLAPEKNGTVSIDLDFRQIAGDMRFQITASSGFLISKARWVINTDSAAALGPWTIISSQVFLATQPAFALEFDGNCCDATLWFVFQVVVCGSDNSCTALSSQRSVNMMCLGQPCSGYLSSFGPTLDCPTCLASEPPILVTINAQGTPIKPRVSGVNCNINNLPHGGYYYNESDFMALVIDSGKPLMRYPGGTVANYLLTSTGFLDLHNIERSDAYARNNDDILANRGASGYDMIDFNAMVDSLGLASSIVLNIYTEPVENTIAYLDQLKRWGRQIDLIELGNELFFPEYYDVFPNERAYLDRVATLRPEIKSRFPNCKLGLIVPNQVYTDPRIAGFAPNAPARLLRWIDAAAANASNYDAVIIHTYSTSGIEQQDESYSAATLGALSYATNQWFKTIDYLKKKFPNSEIWVTEFNVKDYTPISLPNTLQTTYLGAIHNDILLLRASLEPKITLANWHSFSKFMLPSGNRQRRRTNMYQHFSLIKMALNNASHIMPVTVTGLEEERRGKFGPFSRVEGAFLSKSGGRQGLLILVSKSDVEIPLGALRWSSRSLSPPKIVLDGAIQIGLSESFATQEEALGDQFEFSRVDGPSSCLQNNTLCPYTLNLIPLL
uniref:Asl1-like glycosyl hydrolase catalytic domain-containing protein n=1 Tax=Compsopogon caeruleus TaxID=31354 RepID=A0A7S1THA1_9RHOD|mmetsp:Transcript_5987/g.11784  ORF Transcript_5987/g.11784 Transcript_5987/m.11784 type:complete len:651 (+) Transcript_5987:59-2011(+)